MSEELLAIEAPLARGVRGLFTTRFGGVSASPWAELNLARHVGDTEAAVAANRARLQAALGGSGLISVDQVHGNDVVRVDAGSAGNAGTADAMVTTQAGVALAIHVADCLPVLLADPVHQVVAAAHAGRPGLAAGVLQATVAAMLEAGADVRDTVAVIGPGICGGCYEVPEQMRADVETTVPGSAAATRSGTPSVDLVRGAVGILERLGLGQIRRTEICTMEDDRFYSYRRDGVTGRFAGVVMVEADE